MMYLVIPTTPEEERSVFMSARLLQLPAESQGVSESAVGVEAWVVVSWVLYTSTFQSKDHVMENDTYRYLESV